MRGWVLALVIFVAGIIVISAIAAAASNGRDNSGETVRASNWADDVCGTVGAWEGQLEAIGDDLQNSNFAARENDGGSGDAVEQTIFARDAVNRAIRATNDTLQEGLKRAGLPDVDQGQQASAILRNWARETEQRCAPRSRPSSRMQIRLAPRMRRSVPPLERSRSPQSRVAQRSSRLPRWIRSFRPRSTTAVTAAT